MKKKLKEKINLIFVVKKQGEMAIGWTATSPAMGLSRQRGMRGPRVSLRSWQSHQVTAQLLGPFKGVEISLFSVSSEYLQV